MATTRKKIATLQLQNSKPVVPGNNKRLHEKSPQKAVKRTRPAFGDITNKELAKQISQKNAVKKIVGTKSGKNVIVVPKPKTKPSSSLTDSQQSNQSDETSYEVIELSQESESSQISSSCSQESSVSSAVDTLNAKNDEKSVTPVERQDWVDIDAKNTKDIYQVAQYAAEIFEYYKSRESKFMIPDYLKSKQPDLTTHMRAILVDWLVEVQENFELNHETLYLGVKLVDHYLSRKTVGRDRLQLIGATALFIACKFDERCPPVIDDFLYICDDAYVRNELIRMEIDMLHVVGFDIGFPLSYRFLRRYAKCASANVVTLTLGRYLLESSLLDYSYVGERDSRLAAACLLMALRLSHTGEWNATLEHYTGYRALELVDLAKKVNHILAAAPNKHLNTIRTKYSHQIFHEVAKTKALTPDELTEFVGNFA
ncbi:hypothetical protein CAPTEDRAFT_160449 [Capitella teleta]|uniref:Uncharacterized protein n=1 Tax=Capitella teleta TaxID=283909 RepID=R7UYA6_CAPTE|nr:hypothetical protein CAPTEDRAFT_160449 [Capitella teleta]|eukprot:ELU11289.1 hypothetical protein CAPTEDRAFT_160449 [Capitella teleta]